MKIAYLFPGQGAQFVGMGKEFYETSRAAKEIFLTADKVIPGLSEIIFNGPAEKLTATAYCQPAIFTLSLAALKALESHGVYQNLDPQFAAGLSLGEYSALASLNALTFKETLMLVQQRSSLMEEATQLRKGKMAAVIGCPEETLIQVCKHTGAEVANYNSLDQIVITGEAQKIEAACALLQEQGVKRVIPLDVSGAFHSSLMAPAAEKFKGILEKIKFQQAKGGIVSNVDGLPVSDPAQIQKNLARQITSSVQWVKSIQYMASRGIQDFLEIGPGNVLKGLVRKIDSNLRVYNIRKPEDIEAFAASLTPKT